MAKSIIVNRFNQKNHQITLPCDDTVATTVATTLLDGEYQVLKYDTSAGTETETSYKEMQVMVKNTTTKNKHYLNLKVKANKSEEDVFAVLIGATINGMLVDEAFVISNRLVIL